MINEARKMNEAIDAIMRNELKDVFDNVDYIRNMDENELKNIQNMIAAIDAFKVLIVEEADKLDRIEKKLDTLLLITNR
jgi:hypothetical protein